jgi:RNA polymerase sigma-70 factor (ECF subfamily)
MDEIELPDEMRDALRASWQRYLDLVRPLRPQLHAYCRRLTRDLWDAEDLAQETLLKAFGMLGRIHDPIANPRAYLLRVATNLWIDTLRRRETERTAAAPEAPAEPASPGSAAQIRAAGAVLLQRLAPRERAAIVLKDVFDMSLEETADVLESTVEAVKAALHRGRARLRDSEDAAASRRPVPSRALVDRFVALLNAGDKAGLLDLVLDNASAENVGCAYQYGAAMHRGRHSWFEGALGGHPEWPALVRWEAQRAERAVYEGEPLVLLFHTRRGRETLEAVVRLEECEGRVARLRSYGFCPEVVRAVGEALGREVLVAGSRGPSSRRRRTGPPTRSRSCSSRRAPEIPTRSTSGVSLRGARSTWPPVAASRTPGRGTSPRTRACGCA